MVLSFEEAATKHSQDFKLLKTEKKKLEKELKKAQVRFSCFVGAVSLSISGRKEKKKASYLWYRHWNSESSVIGDIE